MANAFDTRVQFHTLYWYGVGAALLLFLSMVLAFSAPAMALLVGFLGWLITMPYHGRLALLVGVSTFGSALLVPFMGRPYLWEFAGILAWTGVPIALMLRQYPPDTAHVIRRNRWIFIGAAIYCATLVELMIVRGVGLRVLGSSVGGGRFYFQQIICAMFPLLFVVNRLDEKMLLRLFIIQLVLRMTYLLSDLAFSVFPGKLGWMLYFLGLSTDMINFQSKALSFGIRRYQSLGIAMPALLYLLLVRYNIRDFFGRRAWWLLPTTVAIVGISLLSGHRSVIIFPA
ncbi:MAG: hypothetical protein J7M29_12245, partial [Verrucomicrobia bacterium]|nr:hypothetical protein [Verrucomicrobiota bacterium]